MNISRIPVSTDPNRKSLENIFKEQGKATSQGLPATSSSVSNGPKRKSFVNIFEEPADQNYSRFQGWPPTVSTEGNGRHRMLERFTHETTIHGMRYLPQSSWFRRFLWMCLILASTTALVTQITAKYKAYSEHGITTYIDLQYPTELIFPAVALCNLNQFRISNVTSNLYPLLEEMCQHRQENITRISELIKQHEHLFDKLESQDMTAFYEQSAHQREDFILTCQKPSGAPCKPDDFQKELTEYGLCYIYNFKKNELETVLNSGVQNGLRVSLNVETYENMASPTNTVGAKVLIFDQNIPALIGIKAMDIPPGFMSLIGINKQIKKISINEGGSCAENQTLKYFPDSLYSLQSCKLNRVLEVVEHKCGCLLLCRQDDCKEKRCTIRQYFECAVQHISYNVDNGTCLDNCTSTDFKAMLSFSQTKHLSLVHDYPKNPKDQMFASFSRAKEARMRNDKESVKRIRKLTEAMDNADETLKLWNLSPYKEHYKSVFEHLKEKSECFYELQEIVAMFISFRIFGQIDQIPAAVEKVIKLPRNRITHVIHPEIPIEDYIAKDSNSRLAAYENDTDLMQKQMKTGVQAVAALATMYMEQSYYTELQHNVSAYTEWNDLFKKCKDGEITYFEMAKQNSKMKNIVSSLQEEIFNFWDKNLKYGLKKFIRNKAVKESLHFLENNARNNSILVQLLAESFFHDEVTIDTTNEDCIAAVHNAVKKHDDEREWSEGDQASQTHQAGLMKTAGDDLNDREIQNYLKDFCPTALPYGIDEFQEFIEMLINCTDAEIGRKAEELNNKQSKAETMISRAIEDLQEYLETYLESFDWKEDFYAKNILGVNIYYQDLSVEHIIQVNSYDFWSLACDIGGTLGLFLGASVLTMFEIIDFFIIRPLLGKMNTQTASSWQTPESDMAKTMMPGSSSSGSNSLPPENYRPISKESVYESCQKVSVGPPQPSP